MSKLVPLTDAAEINPPIPKELIPEGDEKVTFLPMAAVGEDGTVSLAETRPYSEVAKGYTQFCKGDVLIAKITPCMENGKAAHVNGTATAVGCGSTEFHVLRAKKSVWPRYLFHLIWNDPFRRLAARNMTGSAGQKRVPKSFLENHKIPLPHKDGKPDLDEQRRIAAILDKADAIRRKRQQALRLTDDFLRSVFLDMFGDPVTNPKGWDEVEFGELVKSTKLGMVRSSKEFGWDLPVPYVRMDAVTNDGAFLPDKVQGTEASKEDIEAYGLEPGDFLFNTRNSKELVGKVAVFPGPAGATFNNNLMRIRFRQSADPYFVCQQFQFARLQRELEARKQGTTSVFAVYWKNLQTLPILCPPPELQLDFRGIVDKITTVRIPMTSWAAESNDFFASLQQRAFQGEL